VGEHLRRPANVGDGKLLSFPVRDPMGNTVEVYTVPQPPRRTRCGRLADRQPPLSLDKGDGTRANHGGLPATSWEPWPLSACSCWPTRFTSCASSPCCSRSPACWPTCCRAGGELGQALAALAAVTSCSSASRNRAGAVRRAAAVVDQAGAGPDPHRPGVREQAGELGDGFPLAILPDREFVAAEHLRTIGEQFAPAHAGADRQRLGFTQSLVSGTATVVGSALITPLITLYLLVDSRRLRRALLSYFTPHARGDAERALARSAAAWAVTSTADAAGGFRRHQLHAAAARGPGSTSGWCWGCSALPGSSCRCSAHGSRSSRSG